MSYRDNLSELALSLQKKVEDLYQENACYRIMLRHLLNELDSWPDGISNDLIQIKSDIENVLKRQAYN